MIFINAGHESQPRCSAVWKTLPLFICAGRPGQRSMAADETNDRRSLDTGPTFSLIPSLIADPRIREASGCIFVEGVRNFIMAVDQGWSVQTIVYSERLLIAPLARKWVRGLKRDNTPYCRVTSEQFRSISCAQRACRSRSNSASEDRWSRTGVGPRSRVLDGGWSNPHAGESGHTHAIGLRCRCRRLLFFWGDGRAPFTRSPSGEAHLIQVCADASVRSRDRGL
jgi:hypothetical protein